jgi:two-component system NtrC family sensor kinase
MDITERKRAEEERNRMEQQLQLAGRLAAVGELAAGVAHELNNPLAAVQAFAQYLVDRKDLDDDTRDDVQTIYRESQRAGRITSNLLSFARRHRPARSMISINEVVQKSLELNSYRMRANQIEVVEQLDPALPMTMADYHQLEQVFVNIIANSEQAMTEAHGKGMLQISTCVADNMLRIVFTDNGPGIPEDNLKQIFDPFFTTKEVGKGTGLGLSICFGIIQEHGGRIYAESTPSQGATFTVELPILSERQALEVDKHTS